MNKIPIKLIVTCSSTGPKRPKDKEK
jgi:hypothetical protein